MLSAYLDRLARDVGPDSLEGAVLLLALDRDVDRFIRLALGLGPYHPGRKSPWSHAALVAEPYHGPDTAILDCTFRTDDGRVAWNDSLGRLLEEGIARCGGIYDGRVADYDDRRVIAYGVKLIGGMDAATRRRVVAEAATLRRAGYRYDLPRLVRELARLLTGVPMPARDQLLFCSAFCQAAYRAAAGARGDFQPSVATEDVTPDDLWYSPLGTAYLPAPS